MMLMKTEGTRQTGRPRRLGGIGLSREDAQLEQGSMEIENHGDWLR